MNIKKILFLCLLLILAGMPSFAANNKIGAGKMDESILKRRFDEFSTSGAFVLIKLQNTATKETMDIVCENTDWAFMCKDSLKLVPSLKEYTDYMVKNYNKTFGVSDKIYSAMKGAKAGDSYIKYAKTPWEDVKAEFLEKERGFYNLKNAAFARNPDFIKMLLLHNVVVRRDCVSGRIYVQEARI